MAAAYQRSRVRVRLGDRLRVVAHCARANDKHAGVRRLATHASLARALASGRRLTPRMAVAAGEALDCHQAAPALSPVRDPDLGGRRASSLDRAVRDVLIRGIGEDLSRFCVMA